MPRMLHWFRIKDALLCCKDNGFRKELTKVCRGWTGVIIINCVANQTLDINIPELR